jgi:AraC family transcriptional regulator of adaptative response/methylated-DNA-[protein]-cysteine methyltransferase
MAIKGKTPSELIRWTIIPIPEGLALLARSSAGLRLVHLGQDRHELIARLSREVFPLVLERDDEALGQAGAALAALAAGRPAPGAKDLPLDVVGTDFQRQVWRALAQIPAGQTRSYGQIATSIGHPKAARAVGSACAANPIPIIVPCHRAVASDGTLGGYSGGLAIKRALLAAEGSSMAGAKA